MDREAAQARLNRIRAFASELSDLERDGVVALDEHQRLAIAGHHRGLVADLTTRFDVDRDEGQRRMSLGMRFASIVGAVALSASVFLLFYRIWGELATSQQVAILMTAPLVTVALTETAHRLDRTRHLVFVAAIIALASVVMNVTLVGSIFAMADSPNALAVWAAFALLIGYGYGLRLPIAVGLALSMAFAAGTLISWQGAEWKEFARRPELLLPLSAAVFATGAVTATGASRHYAPTHRMVGLFVLLCVFWSLSIDAGLSVLALRETLVKATYQLIGFAASAAAIAIGLKRGWDDTAYLGALAFVVFLYTKFFQWWWDWMPAYLFFFIVGAVAIAMILVLQRVRRALALEAVS